MQGFEKQVQELIAPYENKISALETENQQLSSDVEELKSQLQKFSELMPLLEVTEVFKLEIRDKNLIQKARMLCHKLYPNATDAYLRWKSDGGKRPKDPVRQFIRDVLNLVMANPQLVYSHILARPKYLEVEDD